jgi:superfamily II DNA helicase RecQ
LVQEQLMTDLQGSLRRHFGHSSFRAGQEDLVRAVLDDRDVLAVMPTGSGKSLGFQLPAFVLQGTTLVVSPLISLMKDQVDQLNRRGIRAAALHSMLTSDAHRDVIDAACRREIRLLYVAPERFASEHFRGVLSALRVARFVVDGGFGTPHRNVGGAIVSLADLPSPRLLPPRRPMSATTSSTRWVSRGPASLWRGSIDRTS